MESERMPAFAPRFSLILPTGDADDGLGDDTVGYQLNLPASKIVTERLTLHGNAGATLLPDVNGHDLVSYNLGASNAGPRDLECWRRGQTGRGRAGDRQM